MWPLWWARSCRIGVAGEHQFGRVWGFTFGTWLLVPVLCEIASAPEGGLVMVDAAALLDGAFAAVAQVDPEGMTSGELTEAVLRDAASAGPARGHRSAGAGAVGCGSGVAALGREVGAAWLAREQRLPIQVTRQRIRHARALRTLPEVEEAWAAGEIDRTHVTTMLAKRTPRTEHDVRDRPQGAARVGPHTGVRGLQAALRPLGDARRPRRCRTRRRRGPLRPRGPPVAVVRGHVVRKAHPRPGLRGDHPHHPRHDRTGALRSRLGRRQGTTRARPV